MIVYWTDGLLFLLLLGLALAVAQILRSPQQRRTWRLVFKKPLGMSAGLILACFLCIAVLDSIHYKVDNNAVKYPDPVISALDYLLQGLIEHNEKTYSAPFAIHGYNKETLPLANGEKFRDYPRLQHAGAHLRDTRDYSADLWANFALGILFAALSYGAVFALFHGGYAQLYGLSMRQSIRRIWRRETTLAWRAFLITLAPILLLLGLLLAFAGQYHVLGTDKVGEDILYQCLKSIRTGVVIGTLSTLFMLPFALLLGMMSGYFRGRIDDIIQYIYTTLNAIPSILLIVAAVLIVDTQFADGTTRASAEKADLRLLFLCIILGITSWTGLCRLLRAETMKIRELEFVQAAHAFGVPHLRILLQHILPNVLHIVLISIAIDFSGLVLAEAVLSYIGVGVDPTMHSWGNMVNSARLEMAREPAVWWTLAAAFAFMFTLVLSANLFADAVRDAFDPKTRSRL